MRRHILFAPKQVKNASARYALLTVCAVCAALGLNLLFGLLQADKLSGAYTQVRERQYAVSVLKGLFLYGVFYPALEEAVFRGVLLNVLLRALPVQAAALVSALLFGLYHGNPVQGAYAFLIGLLLAYGCLRMQGLAAPFLMHGAANVFVFLLSSYAPEGSMAVQTLLCAVCMSVCALCLVWERRF